ncbi:IS200/IS605 family transposase [Roseibium sp. MMSF_3361]|uniref:IS200/IS605 family transposase n=2 Tax=unclassified Roseibium TaxID=2629323 RepID=UPI003531C6AC
MAPLKRMIMHFDRCKHRVFYHRSHLVWVTKYRLKALVCDARLRVQEIVRRVYGENRVEIIKCVLCWDLVHVFGSIQPNLSVSDFNRNAKRCSSRKSEGSSRS